MPDTLDLTLRLSGTLRDHVVREIRSGDYDSVSEYVRDLIRRDRKQSDMQAIEAKKVELQLALSTPDSAAPDSDHEPFTLENIVRRNEEG